MKIIACIVSRLGSTRLPAKAMMPLYGKPMIQQLIERVKKSKKIDEVIIATTTLPSDNPLEKYASEIGIPCFRGDSENVSLRMAQACESLKAEVLVELLADNPLIDPEIIDDTIELYLQEKADYAATVTREYKHLPHLKKFPVGVRVQVYSQKVAQSWIDYPEFLTKGMGTTAYIFLNPDHFKCVYLEAKGKWASCHQPDYFFAVNYQEEFDLVERIFKDLYPQNNNFSLPQVINWVKKHKNTFQFKE